MKIFIFCALWVAAFHSNNLNHYAIYARLHIALSCLLSVFNIFLVSRIVERNYIYILIILINSIILPFSLT